MAGQATATGMAKSMAMAVAGRGNTRYNVTKIYKIIFQIFNAKGHEK